MEYRRLRLSGKVAIVTGAGSSGSGVGTGKATSTLFAREGARVLLDGGRLTERGYNQGYFVSPFVYVMEHSSASRVLRDEVFGDWTNAQAAKGHETGYHG